MVGKLFPTTDPDHLDPLPTANFMTQEDIGGSDTEYINDAELRNAPDLTLSRRGAGAALLLLVGLVFNRVDKEPGVRQLYPIAELGKPRGVADAGAAVHAAAGGPAAASRFPASISTSATRSWRRSSTAAIRSRSAR